jgi:hypothetical protein
MAARVYWLTTHPIRSATSSTNFRIGDEVITTSHRSARSTTELNMDAPGFPQSTWWYWFRFRELEIHRPGRLRLMLPTHVKPSLTPSSPCLPPADPTDENRNEHHGQRRVIHELIVSRDNTAPAVDAWGRLFDDMPPVPGVLVGARQRATDECDSVSSPGLFRDRSTTSERRRQIRLERTRDKDRGKLPSG